MATKPTADMAALVETVYAVFVSPNEADSNGEAANVVDGLYAIARGLHAVARAIDRMNEQAITRKDQAA